MMLQSSETIQILLETGHTKLGRLLHQAPPSKSPQGQQTHFPDTTQGPTVHKTIPTATGYETQCEIYHEDVDHNKLLHKVIWEETTPNTEVQDQDHQHSHSKKCLNIPMARVC
jgi:hypothetical protein